MIHFCLVDPDAQRYLSPRDANAILDGISREKNHPIAWLHASCHDSFETGSPRQNHHAFTCRAIHDDVSSPPVAVPKESTRRRLHRIVGSVDDDTGINPIPVPKTAPFGLWGSDVDDDIRSLFLDTERRGFGKSRWLDPAYAAFQRLVATPALDSHGRTRLDSHGIGRKHVDHHFEIARVAEYEQLSTDRHRSFALLQDPQDPTRYRRADIPYFASGQSVFGLT